MDSLKIYGQMTTHSVGIVMKEMVRRVINLIRRERFRFEIEEKESYKEGVDFVTSADKKAQALYIRFIQENFPGFGIVAEEGELSIPCRLDDVEAYLTVDPLDGTKAFKRRQSHGIGTMISLVWNAEVIAACVGDIMTQEIYYYRPESQKVHRVSEFNYETDEVFSIDPRRPLDEQYALLFDPLDCYSPSVQGILAKRPGGRGLFKNYEVGSGSIGIMAARLWKGEVGALFSHISYETPWDICPVFGISSKLGFIFLDVDENKKQLTNHKIDMKNVGHPEHNILIIHSSRLHELNMR